MSPSSAPPPPEGFYPGYGPVLEWFLEWLLKRYHILISSSVWYKWWNIILFRHLAGLMPSGVHIFPYHLAFLGNVCAPEGIHIDMIDWLMDGFNGMPTHLGHVMPKRTMLKILKKMC